jgi:DNA-binding transcriptional ArsR family regulator
MAMDQWVRLPSAWIEQGRLRELRWTKSGHSGSDNIAALMVLSPIAHHADNVGVARCTYDGLSLATGLSRSKVSNGLSVLEELGVIEREPSGRSTFRLTNYNVPGGWSKFPARGMYSSRRIIAFDHFKLRTMTELHALKFFYLVARRRSNQTNLAYISYDKIEEYSDIERSRIRGAISLLASVGLVHVEHTPRRYNDVGTANAYRLPFIDPYVHFGTRGRDPDFAIED